MVQFQSFNLSALQQSSIKGPRNKVPGSLEERAKLGALGADCGLYRTV